MTRAHPVRTADRPSSGRRGSARSRWVPTALTAALAGGLLAAGGVAGLVPATDLSTAPSVGAIQLTGTGTGATAPRTGTGATAPRTGTGCANVALVAIDGNGQGSKAKTGRVLTKLVKPLQARAAREGRTLALHTVPISTAKAATLVSAKGRPAAKSVTAARVKKWAKQVNKAASATRKLVASQIATCPDQQIVLVGYAQGAAVAHRVSQHMDKAGKSANVSALLTVSDPWRVKSSAAGKPFGAPAAPKKSEGVMSAFTKRVGDTPAPTSTFRVASVCTNGDVVCNPNSTKAAKAVKLAEYTARGTGKAFTAAIDATWASVSLWPVPATPQLSLTTETAFSQQLQVIGGSLSAPAATFTPTALPEGVTLSSTGVLSGTMMTGGVFEVRYTVTGRDPVTPPRSALLLLRVQPLSGGVSTGAQTVCDVDTAGVAGCWGRGDFGQLGNATNVATPVRTPVVGDGWAHVAVGGSFTCATKRDGTLWCWGLNNFGQLGGADGANSNVPRQVGTAATWRDVSASWSHACGIQTDGSLWCWGQNLHGQLGNGATASRSSGPVQVAGGQRWSDVTTAGWHSCGVTEGGAAFCWGDNAAGQLGDGTVDRKLTPAKVAGAAAYSQVDAAWLRTCGVTTAGEINCWGDNANGELGNGNRTDSPVPVKASTGGATWAGVSAGETSTCAAATSGAVQCWGDNRYGQLGPAVNVGWSDTPVDAGVTSLGAVIDGGWFHHCAVGTGCWGANDVGQAGNGTVVAPTNPAKAALWGPVVNLTTAQMRASSPAAIAQGAIATRPPVTAAAQSGGKPEIGVMTFNMLGSQHTSPGNTRPGYAPGRVRTEWGKTIIENAGVTLVGTSEPQPDQIDSYDITLRGGWTSYPGNTMGYPGAPQSVMWKDSDWDFVWGTTVSMPFMRDSRPQALVRLRHKGTGREIYWVNAHLSPGKMQDDRDKGMATITQLVKKLNPDGLPILVTGDLNEHAKAFRTIACGAVMNAAVGGVSTAKKCQPPKAMRVDWIFGKRGKFTKTVVDVSPRIKRTTDHAVVSSRFTLG